MPASYHLKIYVSIVFYGMPLFGGLFSQKKLIRGKMSRRLCSFLVKKYLPYFYLVNRQSVKGDIVYGDKYTNFHSLLPSAVSVFVIPECITSSSCLVSDNAYQRTSHYLSPGWEWGVGGFWGKSLDI